MNETTTQLRDTTGNPAGLAGDTFSSLFDRKNLPFPRDLTRDGESASSRRNRSPGIACDPNKVIASAS